MAGWTNPQPIGLSTRTTTASVSCVSEVNGKRYSRERVKLEVIAPPGWPVGYSLYITTDSSPNTRLPINTRSPLPQDPEISLQHAFFVSHPPPLSQQIAPPRQLGYIGFNHPVRLGQRPPHQCLPQWNLITRQDENGSVQGRTYQLILEFKSNGLSFLPHYILINVHVLGFGELAWSLLWCSRS